MTQLAKELLNESQTSRCIINYMIDTWNGIKDNQPKDIWFEGKYLSKGDFIHKTIFDLILLAKINADESYSNGDITLEQLNEVYGYFNIGSVAVGKLEKHSASWIFVKANYSLCRLDENGIHSCFCKDEYNNSKVSYLQRPDGTIELRSLVNNMKEQAIS